MNRSFLSAVQAIGLVIVSFVVAPFVSADDSVKKTKSVVARTLSLTVPAHWDQVKATSTMRAAQFRIPQKGADGPAADLVVFYFGGPTGGVKANVERWVGQFSKEDRKIEMTQAKCEAGSCIIVDAIGTWNKPDGPPFARKTVKTPGSRVINIIVIEKRDGKEDYYFLKLSGPKDHVTAEADALSKAIGVQEKTVKPFDLKDARN